MGTDEIDAVLEAMLWPGQDIVIAQGFGFPRGIASALPRHATRLQRSRILVGLVPDGLVPIPGVHYETFFPSGPFGTDAGLEAAGARYLRCSLYELAASFKDGRRNVDLAIAMGTGPRDGQYSLGLAVDFIAPAANAAASVLLELADDLPWTGAGSTIAHERVTVVKSGVGAMTVDQQPSRAAGSPLAQNLLPLIPEGAAVELGMGRWFSPLISLLVETRHRIRLETGSVGDWVLQLIAAGVIDNANALKATAAGGSRALYDAIPGLGLELLPAHVTHDPGRLATYRSFRAINSVFEVDLRGRANSEVGHGGRRGGLGGLPDFAGAAAASPDGLSIIALDSASGAHSRIVADLPADRHSLPRSAIDLVVTEQGVADLRGKSEAECARAILAITRPDLRAQIAVDAASVGIAT